MSTLSEYECKGKMGGQRVGTSWVSWYR